MDATVENAVIVASKVKITLQAIETLYPDCQKVALLHRQVNTLAHFADVLLDQPAGTFSGSEIDSGGIHPDTGGSGKNTN